MITFVVEIDLDHGSEEATTVAELAHTLLLAVKKIGRIAPHPAPEPVWTITGARHHIRERVL